jgi:hypothetical protein
MARWTCPRCDREFGRAHQSHTCVPGGTIEDSFAGRPQPQLDAFRAIQGPSDVDDELCGWPTEAYDGATD